MTISGRLPYPGLRAFTRDESDLFFGREGSVDKMVDCLAANRFMAVLGPSGSGKSSLVRTGLLDSLELGLLSAAGSHWKIADTYPGGEPMRKLAAALLSVGPTAPADQAEIDFMTSFFRRGPRSIVEWAISGNIPVGTNLLILVDQFEELFRYGDYAQREEAEAFVSTLLESSSTKDASIYVVITMRSEYLGACASILGLAERISTGLYLTPRMDRDECREAIEGPASVLGFKVEPALVTRMLNDLASFAPWQVGEGSDLATQLARQADQLPLMQHVLNRLWLRSQGASGAEPVQLKLSEYEEIGGLTGALDAHGAEVMAALGSERREAIESVFRALVSGSSAASAVRRPCRLSELIEATGGRRADVIPIVEAFSAQGCNFLRTSNTSLSRPDTIVDISHESLIRQWTPLREWLEKEARDDGEWRRLVSSQERYALGEGGLLTGLDYQSSAAWWAAAGPSSVWAPRHGGDFEAVRAYLDASREAEESHLEAERRRQINERRRLRIGIAALAVILIVVSVLGIISRLATVGLKHTKQALEISNRTLRVTQAQKNVTLSQNLKDEHALKLQAIDLNQRILELHAAQKKEEKTLHERDAALIAATAATAKADRDARQLSGALDQISDVIDEPQYSSLLGNADFKADVMKAIQDNRFLIEAQHGVDPHTIVRDDYRNAMFTPPGNVPQELRWLERGFNKGLTTFQPFPTNPPPSETFLADFLDNATSYIWTLFDLSDQKGVTALHETEEIVAHIPPPTTARLFDSLAAWENVESRYFSEASPNNLDEKQAEKLEEQHSRKALDLAIKAQAAPDHNLRTASEEVRLYFNAYLRTTAPDRLDLLSKGCQLADDLYASDASDTQVIAERIDCLRFQSQEDLRTSDKAGARQKLDTAVQVAKSALQYDPTNQDLLLALAQLENSISYLEDSSYQAASDSIVAKDYFIKAIKGRTVNQANPAVLSSIYNDCRRIRFGRLTEGIQFYRDIIDSLSETVKAFPTAKTPASIVGDASGQLGLLLAREPGQDTEAEQYLSKAIDWLDTSGNLKDLSYDYGFFAFDCGWYVQRARLFGATQQPEKMIADITRMESVCSPILEKYPFDFQLRQQFIDNAANGGAVLFHRKEYKAALPYLQYASHWADKDSTVLLATIYQEGLIGTPDQTRAKALQDLAGKQSTASFSAPVDYSGAKSTFMFALHQWPDDYPFKGIADQVAWLKEARGATVDPAVAQSALDCYRVAQEKNVSFPELCGETLSERWEDPQKKASDAQLKANYTKQQKEEALYKLAVSMAHEQKWSEADKALDDIVSMDPDSLPLLGDVAGIYHDQWFQFDRAFAVDRRRVELGGGEAAESDFAEASLTASHYESCATFAAVVRNQTTQKRLTLVMTSLEFACLTAEKRHDAAQNAGRTLRKDLAGLQPVGWTFAGTEQFVRSHHPFKTEASAWVGLFDALEKGDENKALSALTALGVPD